jgi:uncharacterized membrane protein YjjP (DUF1212 family)
VASGGQRRWRRIRRRPGARAADAALLALVIRLGSGLLSAGAETERVEDTVARVAAAYGHPGAEAFAVPTGLFVSLDHARNTALGRVRARGIDLGRLAAWNDLARGLVEECPSLGEAARRAERVERRPPAYPSWLGPPMAGLGNAAFTYLIGGRAVEAVLAFVAGLAVQTAAHAAGEDAVRRFFHTAGGGFLAVLVAAAGAHVFAGVRPFMVVTGGVVLLLPGLSLTAAVRDMLSGDFLAGATRTLEALVATAALAAGVALGAGLVLGRALPGGPL